VTDDRLPSTHPAHDRPERADPPPIHFPRLDRGIVWSDLVAEMEAEWAAKQQERRDAGAPVVDLPLSGAVDRPRPALGDVA